jgi:hypothetical protein
MKRCTYAHPNTYGHECGKPVTLVRSRTSEHTKSGAFHAFRCDQCATIEGPENFRLGAPETFSPTKHTNEWK